jgi:hypothetical protein
MSTSNAKLDLTLPQQDPDAYDMILHVHLVDEYPADHSLGIFHSILSSNRQPDQIRWTAPYDLHPLCILIILLTRTRPGQLESHVHPQYTRGTL